MHRDNRRLVFVVGILLFSLPTIMGFLGGGTDAVFGGFLFNPLDGNSYLAKMRQGYDGSWQFTLPFTAGEQTGNYLFLFYLFLGHAARVFHLPLIGVYHLARLLSAVFLMIMLAKMLDRSIPGSTLRQFALWLLIFGSGLGWIAALGGGFTSDFWVAEAYPFLACYANPHFPLALGLILAIWMDDRQWTIINGVSRLMMGCLLAIILPFGVVILAIILSGGVVTDFVQKKVIRWAWIILPIFGGMPVMLYDFWLTQHDALLAVWDAQNLTLTPPIWDIFISFSPALIMAGIGVWFAFRLRNINMMKFVFWLVGGFALLYFPWSLQRRFMLGLFIPVAVMAVYGLEIVSGDPEQRHKVGVKVMIGFSFITNLLVLLAGFGGILTKDPSIYLTKGEYEALRWLENNTPEGSVILAGEEMGLWIPGYTGRQVLYGHPFETVEADRMKAVVNSFFDNGNQVFRLNLLREWNIDYVLFTSREKMNPDTLRDVSQNGTLVFDVDDAKIYAIDQNPR